MKVRNLSFINSYRGQIIPGTARSGTPPGVEIAKAAAEEKMQQPGPKPSMLRCCFALRRKTQTPELQVFSTSSYHQSPLMIRGLGDKGRGGGYGQDTGLLVVKVSDFWVHRCGLRYL